MSEENTRAGSGWLTGMLVAVVCAGALLRLAGLFCDLWLDEIWSAAMVRSIESPIEVLTALRHDNNHPLNSLWLYLVGGDAPEWVMRFPAWLAGSATVGLAAGVGRSQYQLLHPGDSAGARRCALAAATVLSVSYIFIHYSSEARGYSLAVFFTMVAWWCALGYAQRSGTNRPPWLLGVGYSSAATLAFLAHPSAAVVLLGGIVLHGVALRPRGVAEAPAALVVHGLPALALALFALAFLRLMSIGGGPERPVPAVLGETATYTIGMPATWPGWIGASILAVACGISLLMVSRRQPGLGTAYASVIIVGPWIGLVLGPSPGPYPRYFLVPTAFALVLTSYGLTRLWARGRPYRAALVVAAALMVQGNLAHTRTLLDNGRGNYREALRDIAASSPFREITLTSDYDLRNGTVAAWHADAAGGDRTVVYLEAAQLPARGAQWYLAQRAHEDPPASDTVTDARGHHYRLHGIYPYAALSGWEWAVYRNVELPAAPPGGT